VLAVEGLRSAIQNYEEKHGLVTEKVVTTEEIVRKRLKKVMNPIKGLDMVATHLVKEIDITGGVVRIIIDLPATHQFANAIKEDAVEKIESLWDIDRVIVEFTD